MTFSLPNRFRCDMFHAENYAVYRAFVDNRENSEHTEKLRCDHIGVCLMQNSRAARHPLISAHECTYDHTIVLDGVKTLFPSCPSYLYSSSLDFTCSQSCRRNFKICIIRESIVCYLVSIEQ